MKGYLKPGFVLSGTQYPGAAPCGTNAPTKRVGSTFASAAVAPRAGSIDSRNGSAIVAPMPRRNVRRGSFRFVRKYIASLSPSRRVVSRRSCRGGAGLRGHARAFALVTLTARRDVHLEHVARRNRFDDRL